MEIYAYDEEKYAGVRVNMLMIRKIMLLISKNITGRKIWIKILLLLMMMKIN